MKTCENCEHREVCIKTAGVIDSNGNLIKCDHWQGWIKCEDELPKGDEEVLCVYKEESYLCDKDRQMLGLLPNGTMRKIILPANHILNFHTYIIAWRPLPIYEAEQ